MSSTTGRRVTTASILAAVLYVGGAILSRVAPVREVFSTPTDYLSQAVLVLAFAATIVAFVYLDAWQRPHPRYGRIGRVGSVLAVLGYAIVLVVVIINIGLGGRHLTEVRIVGAVTLLVGSALVGVAVLRAGTLPWWCGVLLIVAFPIGDFVDASFAGGEGIMLALLWGSVAAATGQRTASAARQVGPPVTAR